MSDMKVTTCDWCLQEAPVKTIGDRLWRFWGVVSNENPLVECLSNICEQCTSLYEGFSVYIDGCKVNGSMVEKVLASGKVKDEPLIDIEYHPIIKQEFSKKDDATATGEIGKPISVERKAVFHRERNKLFTDPFDLKDHCLLVADKPFKCTQCNKTFAVYKTFKEHLQIHTGEKPFKCFIAIRLLVGVVI